MNFAAAVVMAFVLAPATPLLADASSRSEYVQTNLWAWRLGWSVWIAAALSLLWFYSWWRARVGASHAPVVIAVFGFLADAAAETALIVYLEATAFVAFWLTGVVANGLYTIGGIWLTLATRLGTAERIWSGVMWAAGITLSVATLTGLYLTAAVATAVLFALFCPWCVYLAVKLR
ncbi:MAG TPA: hypothetical protein VMQ78_07600 [Candidatus Limnocylindria bacterium]|nr:hypothetical protein [Candidatus Limnocylindria bacterium]